MKDWLGGKWVHEARIRLGGNRDAAKRLVGYGRQLVGHLRDLASHGGSAVQVIRKKLPDGSLVVARLINGQAIIEAFAPVLGQAIAEACRTLFIGRSDVTPVRGRIFGSEVSGFLDYDAYKVGLEVAGVDIYPTDSTDDGYLFGCIDSAGITYGNGSRHWPMTYSVHTKAAYCKGRCIIDASAYGEYVAGATRFSGQDQDYIVFITRAYPTTYYTDRVYVIPISKIVSTDGIHISSFPTPVFTHVFNEKPIYISLPRVGPSYYLFSDDSSRATCVSLGYTICEFTFTEDSGMLNVSFTHNYAEYSITQPVPGTVTSGRMAIAADYVHGTAKPRILVVDLEFDTGQGPGDLHAAYTACDGSHISDGGRDGSYVATARFDFNAIDDNTTKIASYSYTVNIVDIEYPFLSTTYSDNSVGSGSMPIAYDLGRNIYVLLSGSTTHAEHGAATCASSSYSESVVESASVIIGGQVICTVDSNASPIPGDYTEWFINTYYGHKDASLAASSCGAVALRLTFGGYATISAGSDNVFSNATSISFVGEQGSRSDIDLTAFTTLLPLSQSEAEAVWEIE